MSSLKSVETQETGSFDMERTKVQDQRKNVQFSVGAATLCVCFTVQTEHRVNSKN